MGYSGKIGALLNAYGFRYNGRRNQHILCPFCGKKYLLVDDSKGVFRCMNPGCGITGGALDFAFNFYTSMGKNPKDKAAAMRMLEADLGIELINYAAQIAKKNEDVSNDVCPIEKRNAVYREMARLLKLSDADMNSLTQRGYTKEQVKEFGYCSLPVSAEERVSIARKIQQVGLSVDGVPGFCLNKDGDYEIADFGFYYRKKVFHKESLKDSEILHFLIPSYDLNGNLQFFQIAWDKRLVGKLNINGEERKFAKYTMFSTPTKKGGGRANATVGYVGYYQESGNTYIPFLDGKTTLPLVEGTLKSALYYELVGRKETVLSLVGVNNYKACKSFLKALKEVCPQVEQIDDCFDMDDTENECVSEGSKRLKEICEELGLRYHRRRWNPQFKGIDDYAKWYFKK